MTTLKQRILDIERRLAVLSTTTNTQSSQISGGETVVDSEGSVTFRDGGSLILAETARLNTGSGKTIIDYAGIINADRVKINGDILSSSDYKNQRETFSSTLIDTKNVQSLEYPIELMLPDWARFAHISVSVFVKARLYNPESSFIEFLVNGVPVGRSMSKLNEDTILSSSVSFDTENDFKVNVLMGSSAAPSVDSRMILTTGGIYVP